MKNILLIFILFYTSLGGTVYKEKSKSQADLRVYITCNKSEATHCIHKTELKSLSKNKKNIWYFTSNKSEADIRIYIVNEKSQADMIIFFVNRSQT